MTSLDMALDEEELSKRKQKAKDMSDLADQKIPEAKSLAKVCSKFIIIFVKKKVYTILLNQF